MSIKNRAGAIALATTLLAGMPVAADARGGGKERGATNRVATKLRAAERALERAQDRIDDGEDAKAVTALTAVRRHLASGAKAADRRVVAGSRTGPASAGAFARGDHGLVGGTAGAFDGATGEVVAALATTLDAELDARDALVTRIAALADGDQAAYARVLGGIVTAAADEAEDVTEALADATLTPEAKAALEAARTQLAATATAADAAIVEAPARADYPGADYPGGTAPAAGDDDEGDDHPGRGHGKPKKPKKPKKAKKDKGERGEDCPEEDRPAGDGEYPSDLPGSDYPAGG